MICALTLIIACGGWAAPLLNTTHAAASVMDTWSTQRLFDLCRLNEKCDPGKVERDPLMRAVESNGRGAAYSGTLAISVATDFIAQRLRASHNRVIRRLWWAPQVGLIIGKAMAVRGNLDVYDQQYRICGCTGPR